MTRLDAIRARDAAGHAFRDPVAASELAAAQDRRWLLARLEALKTLAHFVVDSASAEVEEARSILSAIDEEDR
jgi:hypothetical protein